MTTTPPPSTLSTPSPTEHDPWNQNQEPDESKIPSAAALQEMNNIKPVKPIHLIVATATKPHLGIGNKGQLPWPQIKADMAFFRKATSGSTGRTKPNAVIMGRKTYDSIPPKFRPLANRVNVVLTRSNVKGIADQVLRELTSGSEGHEPAEYRLVDHATVGGLKGEVVSIFRRDHEQATVVVTDSVRRAVDGDDVDAEKVFCIGGAEIYREVLRDQGLRARARVLQTVVRKVDGAGFECDTFWPVELEGNEAEWVRVGREVVEAWTECQVPQGEEEWKRDEKAGVEIQVVGWKRKGE